MKTENLVGSNLPQTISDLPKHEKDSDKTKGASPAVLGAGSFTTFFTWRANGIFKGLGAVKFNHSAINANSRVFVSISEYSDTSVNRFVGEARMAVYNVAPFNGGFLAWVEISWGSPLNVRFDVLVDP